ncbi:miniconductance mechanosensitive channel MscM [Brenneria goodwinii]|uniref:miniconductance mechanosensitive channel MscM n=1 Tax=Brenneria goodwinii TaxID=1109412 RepID=UPI000EF175DE|nr:miniconductance mechanosensitive channel MscM [Brenneria goodwinii]MCG8157750.1 miniconductance mechanosensitive channel MscM [Brenneria goodwinii]MCG8161697.1 miniconductance mechanosensitive channel MscM [Brenneria goodwinii]MCG8166669.1 miniconductance mechanosensitive channel MscM [Brenneria goodwinii]MCG8171373.1 miniconductance mechanosensitive channel MscM [Brenneria goodwinii]MCG8175420.1 miniconductance mechanosensitive channel MscM [Brenneria goodwinii]
MRLIAIFLLGCLLSTASLAAPLPNEAQLRQQLQLAEANKGAADQASIVEELQLALNALQERNESLERAAQYQRVIDDFPKLIQELRRQITAEDEKPSTIAENQSVNDLEQQTLQISSQLLEQARQLQQEQDRLREVGDSLGQLPQQQTEASRSLSDIERRIQLMGTPSSPLGQAQLTALQAEAALRKSRVDELELAQLSASSRQELSRLRAELYKKRHDNLDIQLQNFRSKINNLRQREAEQALEKTELLVEQSGELPSVISEQLKINRELSVSLNQQAQRMDLIASQQRQATTQTLQVRQALSTIREQAQWLGVSPVLGETLRAQIARLPEMPKPQKLDSDMAQLRVQRLHFEDLINKPHDVDQAKQDDGTPLTGTQQRILNDQLRTQRNLLTSLISGCDTQILELTKLKVANSQLEDALNDTREAAHRYLFWVADVDPITFSYPLKLVQDLTRLLSLDTLTQLGSAMVMMVTSRETVIPLLGALLLVGFSISSRRHYHAFLERASSRVGKVTLDHFMLTLRTVFWSILAALPLPVLWAAWGYGLQNAWPYPMAVAIGDSVTATVPLMWVVMISASFSHPQGLFIAHFRWSPERVARAMRYYRLSIAFIVPLIMALITFDKLNDREFSSSLGRLCFILLCMALSLVTTGLKRSGIPLYLDKEGSGENPVNRAMWNILICVPMIAALASCIGYLATAKALLVRLETSVAIWFFLLVIYYIIRRWMLIQRRRIAFDRAKHRRSEILAQRARGEDDSPSATSYESSLEAVEEPVVDLDAISAKSLQLVRSILTLIALVSVIVLWSEIHSAFAFMENISLWDVTSTVRGVESVQSITLGSVLIAVLIFVITAQLVRNLPALLELALLQHLDLSPGSGYAITTISKYILMLIGCMMGFSLIGIEWSKLQWLVAALGVGLGFGLQEIFANFISGLIILFEKPIRIGDTVTIRDLTGSIMRINTRATTISDWDRKEIIVPNKAFITEQFINWSLSDSVTRVVLTIPAPADADSKEVTDLLMDAVSRCSLILDNPAPEAFLVDLQQGVQIFELRIFAAEMGHRMPLRHELHQLILENYRKHNLIMPYPPFQVRMESLSRKGRTLSSASNRTSGGV